MNDDEWLLEVVKQYLSASKDHVVLFENHLARAGDDVLAHENSVRSVGERVIHVVGPGCDSEAITATIRVSRTTPEWLALFSDIPSALGQAIRDSIEVTEGDLDKVVRHAEFFAVGILDGESFALCKLKSV